MCSQVVPQQDFHLVPGDLAVDVGDEHLFKIGTVL
jgi:hypothetical protein